MRETSRAHAAAEPKEKNTSTKVSFAYEISLLKSSMNWLWVKIRHGTAERCGAQPCKMLIRLELRRGLLFSPPLRAKMNVQAHTYNFKKYI